MKVALIGRTRDLLTTGQMLLNRGHQITLVATARSEAYYNVSELEFESFANSIDALYLNCVNLSEPSQLAVLRNSTADVGISINWPYLLPSSVCNCFNYGIVNAHAGDLPRFRGNACPNWAILLNEPSVGLCLHIMQPDSLDSGPILLREYFALTPDTYISDVYEWMARRIPVMFCAVVDDLSANAINPKPQSLNPADWLRCYPRRPEDSRIDWTQHDHSILRLIRASSRPLDGAFSFVENKHKITIWRAELFQHPGKFLAVPGQILIKHEGCPVVACGFGSLLLRDYTVDPMSSLKSLRARLV